MMNPIKTYYIDIDDQTGLEKMSLVEFPAVEVNFEAFADAKKLQFADEEKHEVFGVALLAGVPIYRYSPSMGEYYVIFTKEAIEKIVLKFFKDGLNSSVNVEHSIDIEGVTLIESIITSPRVKVEDFDAPEGSWIVGYKIENAKVWEQVKEGTFKGFSVEGYFNLLDTPDMDDYIKNLV